MTFNTRAKILTGASVLAMVLSVPAMAESAKAQTDIQNGTVEQTTNNRGPSVTEQEIKQGWENTKNSVSKTAKDVSHAVEKKYEDVKAIVIDEDHDGAAFDHTNYNTANTAKNIIGRDVKDAQGNNVAKVHDIIVNKDGKASAIVLSDGAFFGIGGKLVALDYNKVVTSSDNAETFQPVSEQLISSVSEFSYKPATGKVRMVPADGISLRDALGGKLVDAQNKKLADITDIVIDDGDAEDLIVSFDKKLGLGGEQAALDFEDALPLRKDSKIDFQLSAEQTASFESYKKTVTR